MTGGERQAQRDETSQAVPAGGVVAPEPVLVATSDAHANVPEYVPLAAAAPAHKPAEPAPLVAARPDYLDLRNIDRALGVGDVFFFFISGVIVSQLIVGGGANTLANLAIVAMSAFVFSRFLAHSKVYRIPAHKMTPRLLRRLGRSILFTFVFVTAMTFAFRLGADYSREWLLMWFAAATAALLAYRAIVCAIVRVAMSHGHLQRRVAIYGGDAQGVAVIEHLKASDDANYTLVGFYDDRFQRVPGTIEGYERRGGLAELEEAVERGLIDEVIVALPLSAVDRLTQIMNRLSRFSVAVLFAPDLAMWRFFDRPFEVIGGAPMLRAMEVPIEGWAGVAKFIEDRVIAGILLLLISPLLIAVAIAIKLDSKGPVFFRQPRRGWNGGIFTIYKFRSMRTDMADFQGAAQATKDDPRVTRVGKFLRRTSIDELPQLFNVLNGDMSLVGPRPHALGTKAEGKPFEEAVADYMRRYRVKPGITGWAQVNGWRGETDTNRKLLVRVRYDIEYIEHWNFWFDLYILAITPLSLVMRSENAY
ncbi:undecaprenyl-phosphate glucose phosphotransferase [Acuticoccus kandeliae]|uniref:undecaprenyl-phosphate glucose phosphotransferase n=1 Tax=Acuticoccus kandeliae TaxID=2073160 RepID=UPI000D3EA804|nr:undecaprenyl-phosphate glucose phosphotransferase [Acuticoccus kandeliae]